MKRLICRLRGHIRRGIIGTYGGWKCARCGLKVIP